MSESRTVLMPHPARPATTDRARGVTVVALLLAAAGIGLLWAGGVPFPFVVPPGIVVLVATAAFVSLVRKRWSGIVVVLVGLSLVVGFFVSPGGMDNVTGAHGALGAVGQLVMLAGVALAVVSGAFLGLRRA